MGIGSKAHIKEFTDANGSVVRMITAGKGYTLTYAKCRHRNDGEPQGERVRSALDVNPDGTTTVTSTGHNGLILFPTDVPAASEHNPICGPDRLHRR